MLWIAVLSLLIVSPIEGGKMADDFDRRNEAKKSSPPTTDTYPVVGPGNCRDSQGNDYTRAQRSGVTLAECQAACSSCPAEVCVGLDWARNTCKIRLNAGVSAVDQYAPGFRMRAGRPGFGAPVTSTGSSGTTCYRRAVAAAPMPDYDGDAPICHSWCQDSSDSWNLKCDPTHYQPNGPLCAACEACGNLELFVPPPVPGLEPSTKFACQVRKVGQDSWRTAFVFQSNQHETISTPHRRRNGYKSALNYWTHSWVNIEVAQETVVEVKITKLFGSISKAVVHHLASQSAHVSTPPVVSGESVSFNLTGEVQLAVDFDGAMDDTNTAYWAGEQLTGVHPIKHTFSLFANPMLNWDSERPNPHHRNVRLVYPNETFDSQQRFNEDVVYFLPGIHNITVMPPCCMANAPDTCGSQACTRDSIPPFRLQSNKIYYIPADAWLDGWIQGMPLQNTLVLGYGTLSGRMYQQRPRPNTLLMPSLYIQGALNVTVAGLTLVDHIYWHVMGYSSGQNIVGGDTSRQQSLPSTMHHMKIVGWRTNGDGVHVHGWWNVHDMWLRTQDDSIYIAGGSRYRYDGQPGCTFRRITTWNDGNGCPFLLTAGKGGTNSLLDDGLALYARKLNPHVCGGVIELRDPMQLEWVANVTVRNIEVRDRFPTCPMFTLRGNMSNISFENVHMGSPSRLVDFGTRTPNADWAMRWECRTHPNRSFGHCPCRPDTPSDCGRPYGKPCEILNYRNAGSTNDRRVVSTYIEEPTPMDFLEFKNVTYCGQNIGSLFSNPLAFFHPPNVANLIVE